MKEKADISKTYLQSFVHIIEFRMNYVDLYLLHNLLIIVYCNVSCLWGFEHHM